MPEDDEMIVKQFEEFLSALFKQIGYQLHLTKYSGDFGKDYKRVLQEKRYKGNVPLKLVLLQSHIIKLMNPGLARELAKSNGVILIEREQLARYILESQNTR